MRRFQSLKRDNERSDKARFCFSGGQASSFNPSSGITSVLTPIAATSAARPGQFQSLKRDNERSDFMALVLSLFGCLFQSLKRDNERSDARGRAGGRGGAGVSIPQAG